MTSDVSTSTATATATANWSAITSSTELSPDYSTALINSISTTVASSSVQNPQREELTADMIPLDVALFVLIGYVVYFFLIIIGIPANCFVLVRMLHFKRRCPDTYRAGTGACLLAMSIADIVSLLSILFFCIMSFGLPLPFSLFTYRWVCKITIFSLHTATSIAIWSWLLMSILRWLALYRPLLHHTLYNLPVRAVFLVCIAASISNVWLLITVDYDEDTHSGCTQRWLFDSEFITRCLLLAEIAWSFIVPILVVAYLDLSTLLSIPRLISARYNDTLLHNECVLGVDSQMKKSSKTLLRWLAIALIDILLNAPENIRRLATIVGLVDDEVASSNGYIMFKTLSDVFYYSQYSFNAAYLALFIYDRATSSSPTRNPREHSSLSMVNAGVFTSAQPSRLENQPRMSNCHPVFASTTHIESGVTPMLPQRNRLQLMSTRSLNLQNC